MRRSGCRWWRSTAEEHHRHRAGRLERKRHICGCLVHCIVRPARALYKHHLPGIGLRCNLDVPVHAATLVAAGLAGTRNNVERPCIHAERRDVARAVGVCLVATEAFNSITVTVIA